MFHLFIYSFWKNLKNMGIWEYSIKIWEEIWEIWEW